MLSMTEKERKIPHGHTDLCNLKQSKVENRDHQIQGQGKWRSETGQKSLGCVQRELTSCRASMGNPTELCILNELCMSCFYHAHTMLICFTVVHVFPKFYVFLYLKGRESISMTISFLKWQKERAIILRPKQSHHLYLGQAEAMNAILVYCMGCRNPNAWALPHCLPLHMSRKPDHTQSGWDPNRYHGPRCQHHHCQLNPLCHNSNL